MSEHDTVSEESRVNVQAGVGEYETPDGDLSAVGDRVHFVGTSGKAIEIPIDGIVASEYEPATIISDWAYYGMLFFFPGVLASAIFTGIFTPSLLDPLLSISFVDEVVIPVTALGGIMMGTIYLISSVYYARHTVVIHTAAKSYTFTSDDTEIQRIQDVL